MNRCVRTIVVLSMAWFLGACVSGSTLPQGAEMVPEEAAQLNLELGIGYLRQGEWQRARVKLEKALDLNPKLVTANTALGLVYEKLGDGPAAERYYTKAIKLAPKDPDALNSLAVYLCRIKDRREEALVYFDRALAVPLSQQISNKAMLNTNAGTCVKPIDLVRAEVYLRAALAKNPAFGPALLQMADVTYDGGNYLQSRAFLERYTSVPTSAPSPSVLWLGVRIETALGDERAAGRYAVKLKSDFPESREAGLLLAQERNAG